MCTIETQTNLDDCGSADFSWDLVRESLEGGQVVRYWLTTTDQDCGPSSAGIGARWVDGRLWFVSGGRRGRAETSRGAPRVRSPLNYPTWT